MLGKKVFHHSNQLCQTAKAPCSALQYVNAQRSIPIAVIYLGTLDILFDLLCATVTQQTNHLRAGSSLGARCCIQSKISQGLKSKAQSDNLHSTAVLGQRFKLPLPAAPPHGYQENQTQNPPCLRQVGFICNTHKGLHGGGAPAGPAAASGILSSAPRLRMG